MRLKLWQKKRRGTRARRGLFAIASREALAAFTRANCIAASAIAAAAIHTFALLHSDLNGVFGAGAARYVNTDKEGPDVWSCGKSELEHVMLLSTRIAVEI